MKTVIGQQGEVRIVKLDTLPKNITTKPHAKSSKGFIINHIRSNHHHILTGGEVMERVSNVPVGMQIFYAILDAPQSFKQDAANPHGSFDLSAGIYEFRVSREFNPFTEMAQRVAD